MTDSIGNLLPKKRLNKPKEIEIIKKFVINSYQVEPGVTVKTNQIVISVPSAALASSLRMQLHDLQEMCQTKKRLVIQIG